MPRQSIESDAVIHANPIPGASRIGPYITSSIIPPYNHGERDFPESLEDQVANLFSSVGALLEEAGANWDDVAKMTFYVADPAESRPAINGPWEEHFPDPHARPARHNLKVPPGRFHVSCDFVAYVE